MGTLLLSKSLVAASDQIHLHPAAMGSVVLAITALFWLGIRSLGFLFARQPREREPPVLLGETSAAAAAPTGSVSRLQCPHFIVLCLATGAVMHAEALVDAAADLHLHPTLVACVVLSVSALFNWAIFSLHFLVARRPAECQTKKRLRPTGPAASALLVLAALISVSGFVEPFAVAAAELRLPWVAVVVTVVLFAALFNVSIHIFSSFFLPSPPAAAAAQWEGLGAIAAVIMGMGITIAACNVAAGGSASVHAPARS